MTKYLAIIIYLLCFVFNISKGQTCQSSQFSKSFNFPGFGHGSFADTVPGGGFIAGNVRNYKKSLFKTDAEGNFLWAKQYEFAEAQAYSDQGCGKVDKNGNIVIDVNGVALALLSGTGDVITMKEFQISQNNVTILDVFILPDNKKLVYLTDRGYPFDLAYALVCLSPDLSTIVWSKYFTGNSLYLAKPDLSDNKLFFSGRMSFNGIPNGVVFCVDAITGNITKQGRINIGTGSSIMKHVYKIDGGYIATGQYNSAPVYYRNHVVMRLDSNFNVIKAYGLSMVTDSYELHLIAEPDGSYYGCSSGGGHRFAMSATDEPIYSHVGMIGYLVNPFSFFKYNGGFLSIANGNWDAIGIGLESAIVIVKSDENGNYPCLTNNVAFTTNIVNTTTSPLSLYYRDSSFCSIQAAALSVSPLDYVLLQDCVVTGNCNSLQIQGVSNVCGLGSYTYTGIRNNSCTLPVNWEVSGGGIGSFTKEKQNDSTLKIDFLQAGTYQLIGSLGGSCTALSDTINIIVSSNAQSLDFGPPDSTICPGSVIALNAGSGFVSYLWQDGSHEQVYNISAPGQYYVTALSECGAFYSDTINVNLASPTLSIGGDRSKCNKDTIHLSAPPGFLNYSWGNNYNINTLSGQSVVVQPDVDTIYFVKAEKTPGCFAFDTIRVSVNVSPSINLGNDTTICSGNFLTIDAGIGFNNYLWSNGMSAAQIPISTNGVYSVIGTTLAGCKSYDTMRLSVNPLPKPMLNKDPGLCKGSNRTLDAGQVGNYLWQDGSTASSFVVQTTGIYYVQVTDMLGCRGSDTTRINSIYELPSGFLPTSLEICKDASATIQASQPFDRYEWSTGNSLRSIDIANSGLYWLKVTDQHGCKGSDTILVNHKQCMVGVFVPSAFTPNNDYNNDELRPKVFGNVQSFEFSVYNRYGQMIFSTKDPDKGWNGKVNGLGQDAGTFVWKCRYRLNGALERVEKGVSILIR